MKTAAAICLLLLASTVHAQYPAVQIPGTRVRTVNAGNNSYVLYIRTLGDAQDNKKHPVLYVLDGQWNFATANSLADALYEDGAIPAITIVGITWPGTAPDYDSLRQAAFTPNPSAGTTYGGHAADFLHDIQQHIIPFVDTACNTDTNMRILHGGSLGCLFATYTMLHAPGLFNAYVLGSPTLAYDNDTMHKQFAQYKPLPTQHAKVFIALGDEDRYLSNTTRFLNILHQPQFAGFTITVARLASTSHAAGITQSLTDGLRAIFKKPVIPMPAEALKPYAGLYGKDTSDNFTLFIKDGHLQMVYDADVTFTLLPQNKQKFNVRGLPVSYSFEMGSGSKVTGVTLQFNGGEKYYDKVR